MIDEKNIEETIKKFNLVNIKLNNELQGMYKQSEIMRKREAEIVNNLKSNMGAIQALKELLKKDDGKKADSKPKEDANNK